MIQSKRRIGVRVGLNDCQLYRPGMFAAFRCPSSLRAIETGGQVERQRLDHASAGRDREGDLLRREGAIPVVGEPDAESEIHRRSGGVMGGHVDHSRAPGGKDIAIAARIEAQLHSLTRGEGSRLVARLQLDRIRPERGGS